MKQPTTRRAARLLAFLPLAAIWVPAGLALIPWRLWPLELLHHYRHVYFFLLFTASLFLVLRRHWTALVITAGLAAVYGGLLAPHYLSSPVAAAGSTDTVTLLLANVNWSNNEPERLADFITESDPDVVVMLEASPRFVSGLTELVPGYPIQEGRPAPNPGGISLFSRLPLSDVAVSELTGRGFPMITARVDGPQPFTLVGAHPPPPFNAGQLALRDEEMAGLAGWARQQPGHVVVLADLNTSPWSPAFRALIQDGHLRDGRLGHGLALTWPTQPPFVRTALDHCLISPGVNVRSLRAGPHIGSDHFPLLAELSFSGSPP